ncbi:hypothetical protein A2U01_0057877, partial [Trifolium medium]|nr:hypothetical protein [Trifolium medium]
LTREKIAFCTSSAGFCMLRSLVLRVAQLRVVCMPVSCDLRDAQGVVYAARSLCLFFLSVLLVTALRAGLCCAARRPLRCGLT